ncbi:MAG: hypothetical protein ACRD6B_03805 [Bryobacteraceae bacterium]
MDILIPALATLLAGALGAWAIHSQREARVTSGNALDGIVHVQDRVSALVAILSDVQHAEERCQVRLALLLERVKNLEESRA